MPYATARRPPPSSLLSTPSPAQPISTTTPGTLRSSRASPFRYLNIASFHQTEEELDGATALVDVDLGHHPHSASQPNTSGPVASSSRHHHQYTQPLTSALGGGGGIPSPGLSTISRTTIQSQLHTSAERKKSAVPLTSPIPHGAHRLLTPSHIHHASRLSSTTTVTCPMRLRVRLSARLKPWIPAALWVLTSVGFIVAISFYKTEVFQALEDLSSWLQSLEYVGYAIMFSLIFITTFPPFPLYSTLITLSGYSFGTLTGAVISYLAALSGAIIVFVLSRRYLRKSIGTFLSQSNSLKRVCRAIERRPRLLFLIRLAPYPYNVMNVLLAGSPSLTFETYVICTALSLFKVVIHTSIGNSIHSFANYHRAGGENDGNDGDSMTRIWTFTGIALCVGLMLYLSWIARRAVDEFDEEEDEAEDLEAGMGSATRRERRAEEQQAFLGNDVSGEDGLGMTESPFRSSPWVPSHAGRTDGLSTEGPTASTNPSRA